MRIKASQFLDCVLDQVDLTALDIISEVVILVFIVATEVNRVVFRLEDVLPAIVPVLFYGSLVQPCLF